MSRRKEKFLEYIERKRQFEDEIEPLQDHVEKAVRAVCLVFDDTFCLESFNYNEGDETISASGSIYHMGHCDEYFDFPIGYLDMSPVEIKKSIEKLQAEEKREREDKAKREKEEKEQAEFQRLSEKYGQRK